MVTKSYLPSNLCDNSDSCDSSGSSDSSDSSDGSDCSDQKNYFTIQLILSTLFSFSQQKTFFLQQQKIQQKQKKN